MRDRLQNNSVLSENGSPQSSSGAVTEADVLMTAALRERSTRQPNLAAENQALRALSQRLMDEPQSLLRTLVEIAKDLCQADTVGVSLLETLPGGTAVFRWVTIAGSLASLEQTTTPASFSPCGTTIRCNCPQLYAYPERYFTYLHHPQFPIVEGLLFPLSVNSQPLGTIWLVSHTAGRHFDQEDQRLMVSLAGFTATALQSIHLRQTAEHALQREQEIHTQQQQAETSLRQSEAFNQQILDSSDDCIKVLDLSGRLLYMNQRGQALIGIQEMAPFLNTAWVEFWQNVDDRQAAVDALDMARAGGVGNFQGYCPTLAGEPKWWDVKLTPIWGVAGQVERLLCISRDITERRQVEEERHQNQERLRTSEERLSAIFSQAAVGLSEISLEGHFHRVNDELCKMLGRSRQDLLVAGVPDVTHPDDVPRSLEAFRQLVATGEPISFDKRYLRPDGTIVWANSNLTRLDDEQGHPRSVLAVTVDLSDRKRAEEALREREQRLSIATEAAQLGIFEWKVPEDVTIWENDRQYELFGLTPADGSVSAQEFFEHYLHPDDVEALTVKMTEAMQTGILLQTSYRICRKDGTTRWIEVNGQFEYAADGSPLRFIGVNADITERKHAEATILQREAQLRQLADAMPQQVWITDAGGNTHYVNQQWTTYTGLTLEQAQNIHYVAQVIHPDDFKITSELWSTALATGMPYQAEFRLKHQADNTYRWFLSRAIAVRDEQGQIVRWFGTSTDIEEFRRAQAEREQLLAREQAARAEADRVNRIKDEFLAVLSHELRSPLNPILGWSTLLLGNTLDEAKTTQALITIQRNAKLQSELIEDLLDVSRILRGKLSLNVAVVNLVSIIQAAMETVRLAAEAKSIHVEARLAPDVCLVSGDATRLQQVIWNLLSNAVKFTPNGGRVTIQLERLDSHAQISVSDTGQGIEPGFLPYVFDHFRQANAATTRQFGGLGLGLAIVRHLAELHGGTVGVESLGVGMGATFTVRLPLMPTHISAYQHSRSSESSCELNGIQVLIVDDEPDSREFVAFVLGQAGALVMTAATADEALITLMQSKPDVLLSDIGMPDTDGYMLMQQVRALSPAQGGQVPAIALTAYAGDFNQQQALQAGFQQHVSKPVEPEVLVRAIANVLGQTKC
ncbi:PAS domain S-box protein [Leptolyngbya sp. PL-A3]|uniref:PAS domain S-box protein n=1 Tax=Leptolyngbya sp. PL-A3 TaxID=2933911 RepID=UPI003296C190